MKGRGLKKGGEWLKKVFKSDVLTQTEHDEVTSIRSSPVPIGSNTQVFDTSDTSALSFHDDGDTQQVEESVEPMSPVYVEAPTGIYTFFC